MHSETAIESRADGRGRRRKRGNGQASAEGPVFVDTSGRRSRALRRIGLLVGVVCAGYAAVLVMAFMGWGTSLTPSSLLPFGNGQSAQQPGFAPQGGIGSPNGQPSATPSAHATGTATSSSGASSPSPSSSSSFSSSSASSSTSLSPAAATN